MVKTIVNLFNIYFEKYYKIAFWNPNFCMPSSFWLEVIVSAYHE